MAKPESQWTEDDIKKIISGNTNILLMSPHGVATKPRGGINTSQVTFRITKKIKCSAIASIAFKRLVATVLFDKRVLNQMVVNYKVMSSFKDKTEEKQTKLGYK